MVSQNLQFACWSWHIHIKSHGMIYTKNDVTSCTALTLIDTFRWTKGIIILILISAITYYLGFVVEQTVICLYVMDLAHAITEKDADYLILRLQ